MIQGFWFLSLLRVGVSYLWLGYVVPRNVPTYPHLAAYKVIALQAAMTGGVEILDSKGSSRLITRWSQLRKVMKIMAYKCAKLAPSTVEDPDFEDSIDTVAILDMVPKDLGTHKQASHPRFMEFMVSNSLIISRKS